MNVVILIGNLCKESEIKNVNGKALLTNNLAVKRPYKNASGEYETDFISVVFFGSLAEYIGKYAQKGDKLSVQGQWRVSKWNDKDGNVKYNNDCICDKANILKSKDDSYGGKSEERKPKTPIEKAQLYVTDEDLPF